MDHYSETSIYEYFDPDEVAGILVGDLSKEETISAIAEKLRPLIQKLQPGVKYEENMGILKTALASLTIVSPYGFNDIADYEKILSASIEKAMQP